MKMPSSKCKGICQRCGAKSIKFLGPMGKFSSLLETAPVRTQKSQIHVLFVSFSYFFHQKITCGSRGSTFPTRNSHLHPSAPPQGVQNQIDLIDHANTFGKDLQDLSQFRGFLLQRRGVALGPATREAGMWISRTSASFSINIPNMTKHSSVHMARPYGYQSLCVATVSISRFPPILRPYLACGHCKCPGFPQSAKWDSSHRWALSAKRDLHSSLIRCDHRWQYPHLRSGRNGTSKHASSKVQWGAELEECGGHPLGLNLLLPSSRCHLGIMDLPQSQTNLQMRVYNMYVYINMLYI